MADGAKLLENPYFRDSILPTLQIARDGKLRLLPRANVVNLMKAAPNAIVVQHQWNNEYNYSFMEFVHMGYPVIHNIKRFKDFGYYYEASDLDEIGKMLEQTRIHEQILETYKSHAQTLIWTHSPYNPSVQKKWNEIINL